MRRANCSWTRQTANKHLSLENCKWRNKHSLVTEDELNFYLTSQESKTRKPAKTQTQNDTEVLKSLFSISSNCITAGHLKLPVNCCALHCEFLLRKVDYLVPDIKYVPLLALSRCQSDGSLLYIHAGVCLLILLSEMTRHLQREPSPHVIFGILCSRTSSEMKSTGTKPTIKHIHQVLDNVLKHYMTSH